MGAELEFLVTYSQKKTQYWFNTVTQNFGSASVLNIIFWQIGNLGNLLLIVIPAICKEDGSPFGDHKTCASVGLSYASFSMAVSFSFKTSNSPPEVYVHKLPMINTKFSRFFVAWRFLHLDIHLSANKKFILEIQITKNSRGKRSVQGTKCGLRDK